MKSKVFSVTQINTYIKRMFQSDYALRRISIKGQVSNCKYHSSGHIYFSLKDEESQISCVMFASARYNGLQFELEDGQEVIVDGNVSVYERGGSYQLYAQEIRLNGIGELYVAYEMLKQKLYEEGLFDHEIKKPIPKNPKKIGVVTARTGAAIHDIISTAKRRNPYVQLVLYPAKVQGVGASDEIVRGIEVLNKIPEIDMIIAGRGGGSIEDLWSFNEEKTAMAFFNSKKPIISAVGHEKDNLLTDLVADVRAATPTQAVELSVPERRKSIESLEDRERYLKTLMKNILVSKRKELESRKENYYLKNFSKVIEEKNNLLIERENRLQRVIEYYMESKKNQLENRVHRLITLNPLKTLERGYSVVTKNGVGVKSVSQLTAGDEINIKVNDGNIISEVKKIV